MDHQLRHPVLPTLGLLFLHLVFASHSLPSVAGATAPVVPPRAVIAVAGKDLTSSTYAFFLDHDTAAPPFLLDISAPFLSSPCTGSHPSLACTSPSCTIAQSVSKSSSPRCYSKSTNAGTSSTLFSTLPTDTTAAPPPRQCKSCAVYQENSFTGKCAASQLTLRQLNLSLLDQAVYPASEASIPKFTSLCGNAGLNASLPFYYQGVAGFGRSSRLAIQSQIASSLHLKNQFTLCLSRIDKGGGVVLFGDDLKDYFMKLFYVPPRGPLSYTPLIKNPKLPSRYFLGVQSITVAGKALPLPSSTFGFDPQGLGGVEISTVVPFTVLRRDVYRPFLAAYVRAAAQAGASFPSPGRKVGVHDFCVEKAKLTKTAAGYKVPPIQLVLGEGVVWNVSSWNSFVDVGDNTTCLAFVDGGAAAERAVLVGLFQIENNYLVFDLHNSTLGFGGFFGKNGPTCRRF